METELGKCPDDAPRNRVRAFGEGFVQHDGAKERSVTPVWAEGIAQRGGEDVACNNLFLTTAAALERVQIFV